MKSEHYTIFFSANSLHADANQWAILQVWSPKGGVYEPQPDNLSERYYGPREECLAVLNNWYQDGVKWHDLVCEDRLPFVCEARQKRSRPQNRPQRRPAYRPTFSPRPLPYRNSGPSNGGYGGY